jgi:DNA-binding LacI/PurR family transcriptional regulator
MRAVNQLVKEGHLRTEQGKGYYVDSPLARSREGRRVVGFLLGAAEGQDPRSNFAGRRYLEVLPFLQQACLNRERALMTFGGLVGKGPATPYLSPDELKPYDLEAVLVLGIYDLRYLMSLSAAQQSLVALDVDAADLGIDSILFDHLASGVAMVKELARRGARRIAFVGGPFAPLRPGGASLESGYDACTRERYDAWRAGMRASGLPFDDPQLLYVTGDRSDAETRRATRRLLEQAVRPDAILAEQPKSVHLALKDAGEDALGIPVAGWASPEVFRSRHQHFELCSIGGFEAVGPAAVEVLEERLEKPRGPVQRRLAFPPIFDRQGTMVIER